MRRREFIALLGGAATWPAAARAQQDERMRRIGVLSGIVADRPDLINPSERRTGGSYAAFLQELRRLGWIEDRNVRIEPRWTAGNPADTLKYAAERVALTPDVIVAFGSVNVGPLLQATQTVPIVFAVVPDPVGAGFVESLSHPGGNATGFMMFEYGLSGKWLELLKQIAPTVTRAAVLRDAVIAAGVGQFAIMQSVAPSIGVDVSPIDLRDSGQIERAIASFARSPNRGLVVTASALSVIHRDLIIKLAAQHNLPTVYYERTYAMAGGLISYGPSFVEQYRYAAGYADRILRGDKPSDLPVQAPTKYELVVNLKTAKALGLEVPPTLLARADEVIE